MSEAEAVGKEKTTTTTVTERPVPVPSTSDGDVGLDEVLEAFGQDVRRFELYRRQADRKFGYLEGVPVDQFSNEYVAQTWGGGDYRAFARDRNGTYIKHSTFYFSIEGPSIRRQKDNDDDDADPEPGSARAVLSGGVQSVAELVKLIREVQNPPAAAHGGNPLDMAVSLVQAFQAAQAPIMTALLDRANRPADDTPTSELLSIFREGLKLGKESAGRAGADSYSEILDRALPVIQQLASSGRTTGPEQPATGPGHGGHPSTNPGAPAPPALVPAWVTAFRPAVEQMAPLAQADRDPAIYAPVVADQATEGQALFILEQLDRGADFRTEFYQYFPEAVAFRPWWDSFLVELYDALRDLLPDDDVQDVEAVATTGGGEAGRREVG